MGNTKRVLMTGAAGSIGQALLQPLADRYELRAMFHRATVQVPPGVDIVRGDVERIDHALAAVDGCDAVLHLAGNPHMTASFEEVLAANIRGTYSIYEACRLKCVPKVVFASTNHVTGMYERDGMPVEPGQVVRPDSFYGASKAHGEALGRFYSDSHGLSVICLRIGSFLPRPQNKRNLATWLSHRDMVQLAWRSIEADVKFGVYYGISGNTRRQWSIDGAVADLGYAPEDDAEEYASEILAGPDA
mgnify:CR=1 FL=1